MVECDYSNQNKNMKISNQKMGKFRKLIKPLPLISMLAIIIIVGSGTYFYIHYHHSPKRIVTVGTPVVLPNQNTNDSNHPAIKAPSSNNSGSGNSGGVTDTHGSSATSTNSSQWIKSASGAITVKQPTANSKLQDGNVISGSASVGEVHYRLSDNETGVIAQGTLGVVNGNFSGALHFTVQGTGGRLDIFSTDSQEVEYNEVQINVSF
jgi:hypothetical protein